MRTRRTGEWLCVACSCSRCQLGHFLHVIESEGGFFVASTVIVGISQQHAIVQEDIFGSVLTALPYDDLSQAVVLANDTVYGQAANVWSENISRVHHVIARLKNSKGAVNTEGFPHPVLPEGA